MLVHSFSSADAWITDFRAFATLLGAAGPLDGVIEIPGHEHPTLALAWVRDEIAEVEAAKVSPGDRGCATVACTGESKRWTATRLTNQPVPPGSGGANSVPDTNALVGDALRSVRVSVVAIFGIIIPGVWLWFSCTLHLAYLAELDTLSDLEAISTEMSGIMGRYVAWILAFILIYIAGAVLRILPPDLPDSLSLRWAGIVSRDRRTRIAVGDRFPYETLPAYLRDRGLNGLASLLPWDSSPAPESLGKGARSKTFNHFAKLHILSISPGLADHLARQEAFIRLLSGVFWAVLASTLLYVPAVAIRHGQATPVGVVSSGAALLNVLLLGGIVHAFHYQRLREEVMLLSVYFILGPPQRSPYLEGPPPEVSSQQGQQL